MDCKEACGSFWKENKKAIKVLAIGGLVGGCCGFIYLKGMQHGAQLGLQDTIKWLDKTLPETRLVERLTEHLLANPGKIKWEFGNKILDRLI